MLLYLNPNVITAASTDNKAKIALTMLAQAARCGNHIVISDSVSDIKKILEIDGIGDDVKNIYGNIAHKLVYYGNLKNIFSVYVEITSTERLLQVRILGEQTIILMPIEYFNEKIGIIDRTNVLVENLTDVLFYEIIGRYYISMSENIHIPLRYNAINGGGNTIKDCAKLKLEEGHIFTICFVDSDKHFPDGSCGDTLKSIKNVIKRVDNMDVCHRYLFKMISLDRVREIENLIPIYLFQQIDERRGKKLELLYEDNPMFFLFMDIKNGLSYESYNRSSEKEQTFYKSSLKKIGISENLLDRIKQNDDSLCYKDYLIEGFGDGVLKLANEKLNRIGYKFNEYVNPLLSCEQQEMWMEFGKSFYEWTCACKPMRA